jgi:hypothetical protein
LTNFRVSGCLVREPITEAEEFRCYITNNAVIKMDDPKMVEIPAGQVMETAEGVITQRHSKSLTVDVIEELLRNARGALTHAAEERERTGTFQQRRAQA